MTCIYICLYETTLVNSQVDEFIIKSLNGQVHYESPQVDRFIPLGFLKIIKSTSGRVHY